MPQFRLTAKFADDYGIKLLSNPYETASVLDDWLVDVLLIQRRKVAVVIHVKSLLAFFIPYKAVGGAKNILNAVTKILDGYLHAHNYYQGSIKAEYEKLLNSAVFLCKTENKKVLGNLNDFKRCLKVTVQNESFNKINWSEVMTSFQNMPVNVTSKNCCFPEKKFRELMELSVNKNSGSEKSTN